MSEEDDEPNLDQPPHLNRQARGRPHAPAARRVALSDLESSRKTTMLRIDLIGNLGSEPDLRHTQANRDMLEFRVAINQRRRGDDGQWEDAPAEWFRIRAMGPQLERARNLTRGDRVFVAGRLDIGHYTSRDGEPRTGFDVWADEITNLTPRPSSDDGRPTPATAKSRGSDDVYDEGVDLPF